MINLVGSMLFLVLGLILPGNNKIQRMGWAFQRLNFERQAYFSTILFQKWILSFCHSGQSYLKFKLLSLRVHLTSNSCLNLHHNFYYCLSKFQYWMGFRMYFQFTVSISLVFVREASIHSLGNALWAPLSHFLIKNFENVSKFTFYWVF